MSYSCPTQSFVILHICFVLHFTWSNFFVAVIVNPSIDSAAAATTDSSVTFKKTNYCTLYPQFIPLFVLFVNA